MKQENAVKTKTEGGPNGTRPEKKPLTEAERRLCEDHLRLVPYMLRETRVYLPEGMTREDLVQCGYLGLMDAVRLYRPEKGAFSTFACYKIRCALLDGVHVYQTAQESFDYAEEQGFLMKEETESFFEEVLDKVSAEDLLGDLCPEERRMIEGCVLEGKFKAQMARELSIDRTRARRLYERALSKIAEKAEKYGFTKRTKTDIIQFRGDSEPRT